MHKYRHRQTHTCKNTFNKNIIVLRLGPSWVPQPQFSQNTFIQKKTNNWAHPGSPNHNFAQTHTHAHPYNAHRHTHKHTHTHIDTMPNKKEGGRKKQNNLLTNNNNTKTAKPQLNHQHPKTLPNTTTKQPQVTLKSLTSAFTIPKHSHTKEKNRKIERKKRGREMEGKGRKRKEKERERERSRGKKERVK